ncbi:MAG: ABC-F family ATP-binding cassette domain-containing protein [Armatimonadetes bacterium]|nr:ABC-F family ATP-binding cassette domain-containing protein [Armatimonadota bacterium]
MRLLVAERLTKYYGAELILEDVALTIHEGDRIGLIGANGTGKTTLCRLLLGETEADDGVVNLARGTTMGYLAQDCTFPPGQTLWQAAMDVFAEIRAMEERIAQLEEQMADPGAQDLDGLIARHEAVRMEYERAGGYEYEVRAATVLTGLGLREADFHRPLDGFSGGEKNRAALAVLLLRDPDLLLLDEPTNHLDIQGTEWLEQYLATYHGAAVVISHDRRFLNQTVRRIVELSDHRLTEYVGDYDSYVRQKDDRLLHYERTYEKQQRERQRQLEFVRWALGTGQEKLVRAAKSRLKLLDKVEWIDPPVGRRRQANLRFTPRIRGGDEIAEFQDVTVGYDAKPLVRGVDLIIRRGDRIGLVGPNGSGKTTLLKVAIGQLEPLSGRARLGRSVEVGYFAQERIELNPENIVIDDFAEVVPDASRGELRHLLARFLFVEEDVFKTVGQLSGGEMSRLALAKLIMTRPTFLVLDEPTNHLDIDSRGALETALREYSGTLLVVSHDRYFLDAVVNMVLVIEGDRAKLHDGNYSAYRAARLAAEEAKREAEAAAREEQKLARLREERLARRERRQSGTSAGPSRKQMEKRAAALEEQAGDLEARIVRVEALLAGGEVYDDPARVRALSVEHQRLHEELHRTIEEWEALAEALDE